MSRGAAAARVAPRAKRRDEECMMKRLVGKREGSCVIKMDVFGFVEPRCY